MYRSRRAFLVAAGHAVLAGCGGIGYSPTTTTRQSTTRMTTTQAGMYVYDERYKIRALTVASGTVVAVTKLGDCYGLDAATGDRRWRLPIGGSLRPPTPYDGRLYVGGAGEQRDDGQGTAYAVEIESGETIWAETVSGEPVHTPAVVDETVYFGTQYHGLEALATADGETRWSDEIGDAGVWLGSPVVKDGVAYFGGRERVYAYDLDSRSTAWTAPYLAKGGAVVEDRFCFGAENTVTAVDATSGEVAWEDSVVGFGNGPAVADDTLIFTEKSGALAVDITGERLWDTSVDDDVFAAPATDGERVYVPSMGGTLLALGVNDGEERWSYVVPEEHPLRSTPVRAGDRVYVGDHAGNVHALDAASGEQVWTQSVTPE